MKKRLEKDAEIAPLIQLSKIEWKGCLSFWLNFNANLPAEKAVAASYLLATKYHLYERATYILELILTAFRKSKEMEWRPTLEHVKQMASGPLPEELEHFICLVFSGNEPKVVQNENTKRFVYSVGQDICRVVSLGRWKLAKHVLICTTITHLYRSKQLTNILNRHCHCESYSFRIELETALAKALEETSAYLTPEMVSGDCNKVFHRELDNLNKILTNVTESNVVNSTAGIMLQEVKSDNGSTSSEWTLPTAKRNKE